ncbi:aspartyl protease family protein [Patescibacteria group bacterium]
MSYSSTFQSPITQQEVKPLTWLIVLKILYIVVIITLLLAGAIFFTKNYLAKKSIPLGEGVLLETNYKMVLWRDFGEVFEPVITIPVYYPSIGFEKQEFLLDSGAVVSSLPREKAKEMGYSLAKLPRSTFAGFGGTTSFAYKASVKLLLGETEIDIPVVFTEAAGTKAILGRSGFFENYSVYFNSKADRIEISM